MITICMGCQRIDDRHNDYCRYPKYVPCETFPTDVTDLCSEIQYLLKRCHDLEIERDRLRSVCGMRLNTGSLIVAAFEAQGIDARPVARVDSQKDLKR